MGAKSCTDEELAFHIREHGASGAAKILGMDLRAVQRRRRRIENTTGINILSPYRAEPVKAAVCYELAIQDGIILVASDAHYWPGDPSMMHRALVRCAREMTPKAIIMNGDVLDFPSISRHAAIGWESRPKVVEEIKVARERLDEIVTATPNDCATIWTLGNHDARYETKIANDVPEFAEVEGVHLHDHFDGWARCWRVEINNSTVVKHRFKGGIHATHNNTLWAGRTIVTGHLHSAKVTPFDDYNGTRWGVDTGCIADTDATAFAYLEDNPRNWRSAFCVLTYRAGILMQPELVLKWDKSHVQFRGEIIEV